ncbi:MAG: histidine kinase, partial [Epsilonproteobacteria bacterium]
KKTCSIYQNEIIQVILNLLKNASDALQEANQKQKHLSIMSYDTSGKSVIEICDNGKGIPAAIQSKIFDPYFSTKGNKVGTGLGLYMSKTLIEEHNDGQIEFTNIKNKTCFMLKFSFSEMS